MKIQILGITGPSGAGKSLLCQSISARGIPVIDADRVYHSLLLPPSSCLRALRDAFGDEIFDPSGALNRATLSKIVFHDKDKLILLNQTVLHFVLDEIREQIASLQAEGHLTVAVDAPTLIESGFHKECDRVISVLAPASLRAARIRVRDSLTEEQADARIAAQPTEEFYRAHSHAVIENNGSEEALQAKIQALFDQLSI